MPPFEFYRASQIINEHKVFLRDFSQSWYHAGLQGVSTDIDSTAAFLESVIDEIDPERIFFVGNSMGGYAAMLFASLIGKGEAVAFAPQTFISSELRARYNDPRWAPQIDHALGLPTAKEEAQDLRALLLDRNSDGKQSVFVAKDNPLDLIHASHVEDCPGVQVFQFDTGGHSLVRELRDQGMLPQIMKGQYA